MEGQDADPNDSVENLHKQMAQQLAKAMEEGTMCGCQGVGGCKCDEDGDDTDPGDDADDGDDESQDKCCQGEGVQLCGISSDKVCSSVGDTRPDPDEQNPQDPDEPAPEEICEANGTAKELDPTDPKGKKMVRCDCCEWVDQE